MSPEWKDWKLWWLNIRNEKEVTKHSVSWYTVGVPQSTSGLVEEEEFYFRLMKRKCTAWRLAWVKQVKQLVSKKIFIKYVHSISINLKT